VYRKSEPGDCRAIYDLICDMEGKQLPYDRFREIYLRQLSDTDHFYCLICEIDDRVVGMLNLRFEEQLHHAGWIAEIMEFVVDPSRRSKGVGAGMFKEACRIARERGCPQIEVACNQLRTHTHRFYLRQGMKNYHYKFSLLLEGEDSGENVLGR